MLWRRVESNSPNTLKQLRGVRLRRCEHDHDHRPSPQREEYVAAPSAFGNGLPNSGGEPQLGFWRAALSDERMAWIGAAVAAVDGANPPQPAFSLDPNLISDLNTSVPTLDAII
jgi:hypothetical protein